MLHLTVADRVEPLAARLAAVLQDVPADPMVPEWIATPGGGMRSWLWLELARHLGASAPDLDDGIIANVTAAFPGTLRTTVLQAASDTDVDPWTVDRLVWNVLDLLGDRPGAEPSDVIRERFGTEPVDYGRARRIADLFDRYHLHRPDLIRRWADGHDVDAAGAELDVHARWQPRLWRLLRERIDVPSPPEALPIALQRLRSGDFELDLPERLSVFGLPSLPGGPGFIDLADAVAAHRDVHLFLLDPSPAVSDAIRARIRRAPAAGPRRRADDQGDELVDHPLLRSWGRLPRETTVLLTDAEARGFPRPDVLTSDMGTPTTLLQQIQADLRAGHRPDGTFRPQATDQSVQFHTAYGRSRQVDIARDSVLHALRDDPTLTEDDVLVLCPALDQFESIIPSGFGPSTDGYHPRPDGSARPPSLRYRIADRSIGRQNPVLDGFSALLRRLPGRLDLLTVQGLLAEPSIRARFDLGDEALGRIADWADEAVVRWGLDPQHRGAFGVAETVAANSWISASDRVLLGATVPDDDLAMTVGDLPAIGTDGDDVEIAGQLAEFLERLRVLTDRIGTSRHLLDWLDLFGGAVDDLLAPVDGEVRDLELVRRVLREIRDDADATPAAETVLLTFADVKRLLDERLAAAPSRPPFFRGGVTITSPDSLRSIPFRIVVLLGMDQRAFGVPATDGDDLVAAVPLLGDREPRSDRRQAILDAVLAAGDRLIVIRDGTDLRTNQAVPAAVVVTELQDVVRKTIDGGASASIEIHHPRHGFDERCFLPGALGDGPWGFDPRDRDAARARRDRVDTPAPFLDQALEPVEETDTVELGDLIRAVQDPVGHFLRARLGVRLPDEIETPITHLPVALEGLDRWSAGQRLLDALRSGHDADAWLRIEKRRGILPEGRIGAAAEGKLREAVDSVMEAARKLDLSMIHGDTVPIDVTFDGGVRLIGSVSQDFDGAIAGPLRIGVGRIKASYRLAAWIDLMALVVADPDRAWQAAVINYDHTNEVVQQVCLQPVGESPSERAQQASMVLDQLVDLMRRARCEPLPLFPEFSAALHANLAGDGQLDRDTWRSFRVPGDGDRPITRLVFGSLTVDELRTIEPADGDPFEGSSRAEGWAQHLWNLYDRSVTDTIPTPAGADQ